MVLRSCPRSASLQVCWRAQPVSFIWCPSAPVLKIACAPQGFDVQKVSTKRQNPRTKLEVPAGFQRRNFNGTHHHKVGSGLRRGKDDPAAAHSEPDRRGDGGG